MSAAGNIGRLWSSWPLLLLDVRMTNNPGMHLGPFFYQALHQMSVVPRICPLPVSGIVFECRRRGGVWPPLLWCSPPWATHLLVPFAASSGEHRCHFLFVAPLCVEPDRRWGFRREEGSLCFWTSTSVKYILHVPNRMFWQTGEPCPGFPNSQILVPWFPVTTVRTLADLGVPFML